jgi:hypothetical protein
MRGPVEASFGCHASQEPFEFRKYIAEKVGLTGDQASLNFAEGTDGRHR